VLVVDIGIRIRDDSDHPIGVALDLWCLGTQWTDSFRPDELEVVRDEAELPARG
jgi:hypothetical protein